MGTIMESRHLSRFCAHYANRIPKTTEVIKMPGAHVKDLVDVPNEFLEHILHLYPSLPVNIYPVFI